MSNSVRPHRRQPTRLPQPWNSLGKNAGVGCHCLLQCMKVKSESEVAQLCLTLSDALLRDVQNTLMSKKIVQSLTCPYTERVSVERLTMMFLWVMILWVSFIWLYSFRCTVLFCNHKYIFGGKRIKRRVVLKKKCPAEKS